MSSRPRPRSSRNGTEEASTSVDPHSPRVIRCKSSSTVKNTRRPRRSGNQHVNYADSPEPVGSESGIKKEEPDNDEDTVSPVVEKRKPGRPRKSDEKTTPQKTNGSTRRSDSEQITPRRSSKATANVAVVDSDSDEEECSQNPNSSTKKKRKLLPPKPKQEEDNEEEEDEETALRTRKRTRAGVNVIAPSDEEDLTSPRRYPLRKTLNLEDNADQDDSGPSTSSTTRRKIEKMKQEMLSDEEEEEIVPRKIRRSARFSAKESDQEREEESENTSRPRRSTRLKPIDFEIGSDESAMEVEEVAMPKTRRSGRREESSDDEDAASPKQPRPKRACTLNEVKSEITSDEEEKREETVKRSLRSLSKTNGKEKSSIVLSTDEESDEAKLASSKSPRAKRACRAKQVQIEITSDEEQEKEQPLRKTPRRSSKRNGKGTSDDSENGSPERQNGCARSSGEESDEAEITLPKIPRPQRVCRMKELKKELNSDEEEEKQPIRKSPRKLSNNRNGTRANGEASSSQRESVQSRRNSVENEKEVAMEMIDEASSIKRPSSKILLDANLEMEDEDSVNDNAEEDNAKNSPGPSILIPDQSKPKEASSKKPAPPPYLGEGCSEAKTSLGVIEEKVGKGATDPSPSKNANDAENIPTLPTTTPSNERAHNDTSQIRKALPRPRSKPVLRELGVVEVEMDEDGNAMEVQEMYRRMSFMTNERKGEKNCNGLVESKDIASTLDESLQSNDNSVIDVVSQDQDQKIDPISHVVLTSLTDSKKLKRKMNNLDEISKKELSKRSKTGKKQFRVWKELVKTAGGKGRRGADNESNSDEEPEMEPSDDDHDEFIERVEKAVKELRETLGVEIRPLEEQTQPSVQSNGHHIPDEVEELPSETIVAKKPTNGDDIEMSDSVFEKLTEMRSGKKTINKREPFLGKLPRGIIGKLETNAKQRKQEVNQKLREKGGELLRILTRKARVKHLPLPRLLNTAKYGMYADDYLHVQKMSTTLDLEVCRGTGIGRTRLPFLSRNLIFNRNRAFRAVPEFNPAEPPKAVVHDPSLPMQERFFEKNRGVVDRKKKNVIINAFNKQLIFDRDDTLRKIRLERGVPGDYSFSLGTIADYSMTKRSALYNDTQFMRFVEKDWMADPTLRLEIETARALMRGRLKEIEEEHEKKRRDGRAAVVGKIDRSNESNDSEEDDSMDDKEEDEKNEQATMKEHKDDQNHEYEDDSHNHVSDEEEGDVELTDEQYRTSSPTFQFDINELATALGDGAVGNVGHKNPKWTEYLKSLETFEGRYKQFREHEMLSKTALSDYVLHDPPIDYDKDPHEEGRNVVTVGTGYPHRNTFLVTRLRHSLLTGHRTAFVQFWYQVWSPDGRTSQLFPAHLAVDNRHWSIGCSLPVNERLLATHPTSLDMRQNTFRDMPEGGNVHVIVWVVFSGDLSLKDARGRPSRDKQKAEKYRSTRREEEFDLRPSDWESCEITTFFGTFHLGEREKKKDAISWDYGVKSVVLVEDSALESAGTSVLIEKGKETIRPQFALDAVEEIQHVASRAHGTPFLEMEFYNDDFRTRDLKKKACPLYQGTGTDCLHENPAPASVPRPRLQRITGQGLPSGEKKVVVKAVGPPPDPQPEKEWAPMALDSENSSQCDDSEKDERETTADEEDGPPAKPDRSGLPVLDFVKAFSGINGNIEFETIPEFKENINAEESIKRQLEKLIGCSLSEANETQRASLELLQRLDFPEIIYYRFPHKLVGKCPSIRDRSPPRKELCRKPVMQHHRWTRRLIRNIPFFRVELVDKKTKVVRVLRWKDVKRLPEKEKRMMIANFGRPIDFALKKGGSDGQTIQFLHGADANLESSKESTPSLKVRVRHTKASKSRVYSKKTVDGMEKAIMKQVIANVTRHGHGPRGRPARATRKPKRFGEEGNDEEEEGDEDEGWDVEESPEDSGENSQEGSTETKDSTNSNDQSDKKDEQMALDSTENYQNGEDGVGEASRKKARIDENGKATAAAGDNGETADSSGAAFDWKPEWGTCREKKQPGANSNGERSNFTIPRKHTNAKNGKNKHDDEASEQMSIKSSGLSKKIEDALDERERREYTMQRLFNMEVMELRDPLNRQSKMDKWIKDYLDKLGIEKADEVRSHWMDKGVNLSTWPYEQLTNEEYDKYEVKISRAKKEWIEQAKKLAEFKEYVPRKDGRGEHADELPLRNAANSQLAYRITQSTTPNRCIMCEKACRNMFDLMMHYTLTHIRFAFLLRQNIQIGENDKHRLEDALVIDVHLDVDADTTKDLLTYEPRTDKPVDCLIPSDLRKPRRPVKLQSKTGNLVYMTTPMETGLLRDIMRMSMLTFTKEIVTPSSLRRLEADRVYGKAENELMEFDHLYNGPGAMTIMEFQTHFWERTHDDYLNMNPVTLLIRFMYEALDLEYPEVSEYDRMRLFLRCNLHIIKEDLQSENSRVKEAERMWVLELTKRREAKEKGIKRKEKTRPFVRPQRNLVPYLIKYFHKLVGKGKITLEDCTDLKQRVFWALDNPDFFGEVDKYDPIRDRNSPLRMCLVDKLREEYYEWMEEEEEDENSSSVPDRRHPDTLTEKNLRRALRERLRDREGIPLLHHAESEVKRIYGFNCTSTSVSEWMFPPVILFRNEARYPAPTLRVLDKRLGKRAYSRAYFNERALKKRCDRELRGREMTKAVLVRHYNQMEVAKINLRE